MKTAVTSIVFIFSLMCTGISACSPMNPEPTAQSNATLPVFPVLPTAIEFEHNGVRGLWMSEDDVANLMLWIHNVSTANK